MLRWGRDRSTRAIDERVVRVGGIVEQVRKKVALQTQAGFDHGELFRKLDGRHRRGAVGHLVIEVAEFFH
jgi:hypothetical protein